MSETAGGITRVLGTSGRTPIVPGAYGDTWSRCNTIINDVNYFSDYLIEGSAVIAYSGFLPAKTGNRIFLELISASSLIVMLILKLNF